MHVIAVSNRKGGVGKSAVAVNLASALTLDGNRVLLLDMDSQASATATLLDELSADAPTMAHVMVGQAELADVVVPTTREGLRIAPASKELTHAQLAIVGKTGRETILKRALRAVDELDFVVIDTAPEQQLATVNSLVAATHVLMPFTPDPKALEGLHTTAEAVLEINEAELSEVNILGCVQVAFDRRLAVTHDARQQVAAAYGERLFDTVVRTNAHFVVCPAWHRDIFAIETKERPPRRGSEDYQELAREVVKRIQLAAAARRAA